MPATDTERLVVSLEARIKDFEKNFQKAGRTSSTSFDQIERRAKQNASRLEASMGRSASVIGRAFSQTEARVGEFGQRIAGALAGAVALKQAQQLVDAATRIKNALKVAGLEGENLEGVYRQLYNAAQENAAPLESLVTLYGRLSLVQKELGVNQQELIQFSKNVSLALRVGGQSAEEASGALLQLSQALGGGTVRAEEFNSVLEGAPTIAQAVAAGLTEAGGSVAKLRNLVVDGKVSSQAFFRAFEVGAATLEEKVASSQMTVAQNFVRLQNVLIDTAGKIDTATGASAKFGTTLADLATTVQQFGAIVVRASDSDLGKFVGWLSRGVDAASEFKKIMGGIPGIIDKMGSLNSDMFQGKALGSGLKAEAIQNRINQAFDYPAAPKTGRLPAKTTAPAVTPRVSINDYPAPDSVKEGGKVNVKVDLAKFLAPGKDASHISGMSSAFEGKLEKLLGALPKEMAGQIRINSGFRSVERQQQLWQAALEKYGSVAEARKWVAPPGNSQHNKGNAADLGYGSDAARQWAHKNAGQFGLQFPLSNENWHIEDADARAGMMADKTKDLESRGQAYDDLLMKAREFVSEQGTEQQAFGLTAQKAAALRYEQEMLNEAARAGIALTPQQRAAITGLAQDMASAEQATTNLANSQEQAQDVANFFASSTGDAIMGLIDGSKTAEQAIQGLIGSIAKALLQAALLGDGPLGSLMGGGGGILGTIFKGIFSGAPVAAKDGGQIQAFAAGGRVRGPGTSRSDSVPAWLSDGEHVVNAKAAGQNRALLESINAGHTPKLAKVKLGGGGGNRSVTTVQNTFSPTIPITVQASGNKDTDDALVSRLSAEMDTMLDNKMVEFVKNQQRPGNMLNQRGFF
ncbi:tape measure domain-containing protein [Rhizobium sp. PP-CC-2G-626]|nr:tape measure domain-containing protein [Rhizobium sp. PP-CC-2G-626]